MSKEKILEYFSDINYAYNDCTRLETLKNMLNELEDVVHGEWIHVEGDESWEWTRSACMKNSEIHGEHPNFCQNCGAKMDGGNENE